MEFGRHADGRFLTRLVKKIGPDADPE
jgi:hypothetical protein